MVAVELAQVVADAVELRHPVEPSSMTMGFEMALAPCMSVTLR